VGLKLKMKSHGKVKVSVESTASKLMAGKVDGVIVEGEAWASPQQLTCRVLRRVFSKSTLIE
jgi:hypothetical protein